MILDRFENLMKYEALIPNLAKAVEFCKTAGSLAPGRYEFEGGFVLIQEGETASTPEEGNFEAHKEYVDVQVLAEGAEVMAWADISGLELAVPYKPDAWFFSGQATEVVKIQPGVAYVMFPHDGHKACCHLDTPTHYRKYVIKCPVQK